MSDNKYNLYSIKDKLMGFTGPVMFKDDNNAIRWFESLMRQRKETEFVDTKYWDLYQVGQFDIDTGETVGTKQHEIQLIREGENI